MRKKRSRLISIFLTVAMVLSFVPSTGLTAYAEGETEVSTWEDLRAELKKDGDISVKLTDDIKVELAKTGDEYVNSAYRADITGGNKRLDLNGHTLYVYSSADVDKGLSENAVIALKGNGSLEVLGGGRIFYDNRAGKRGGDGAANAIKLSGNSKLTVTNATIENFYGSAVSMEEGSPQVTLGAGAYLFSANGYGLRSLYSCTGGSVTLDDGVELGNKDTSQTRFYVKGLDGSGNGAMRLANENTSLTINNAVFNGVVEVAGENQKTAFRASGNRFIVDGEEQTDDSLWCDTKSTDLNGWNVAGRFLLHNKEHITKPTQKAVVISSTVSVLSADVDAPAHNGETSDFGAYSSNTDLYTVDSVKWYAGETADGTPMGESEKFRGGDKYTVAVSFKLVSGYNFDSTVTAFLNGKKAVVRDGGDGTKIAVLTFTATELEQKILTAPLTITAPVAEGVIAKDLASSDSRIKVTDCEWYMGEGAEATRKVDGTFNDGGFYTLYFRIEAQKGYSFDNGAIVTVNGKPATVKNITSKGEIIIGACYFVIGNDSYDFTEIWSGNVIITEPSAGKELSNVTVAYGSRFDVSDYYWYLGEGSEGKMALEPNTQYIGGALYTLVVRFTPKDGYKFANNMNIFVNGKKPVSGGVASAKGDGYIGYYVFSVDRDATQVENISLTVKNPVAGEIVNGNDDYQIKAPFDSRYKVNLPTSWYEGEYATQAELTGKSEFWGTFEAGKKYTCYTRVVPKDGYEFPSGGGLTLNNQMVTNKDYFPGVYFILYTFTVPTGGSEKTAITDTLVPVSDLTKTFENNKTKEPTFGGSLTKGTDYTVSYAVKAGSTGELKDDKPYGTGTYVVTVTGIGSYKDSFTKEFVIEKAVQEAPSGLAGVAPTTAGGSDGKITGTTADMEYSTDAAFASKFDCTDTETTGLAAGTYYVRYKEKTNYYAGTAATVTVGEGTPVATYTLTVNEGTGSGDYAENVIVTIQANAAATGKQFKEWTGLDSVEFVDSTSKTSATAKFKMPAETVTATATYEDVVTPPSHTHTYDGTWKFDENKHWKVCADISCNDPTGSVKDEASHSFAEVVTPATPTTDGKKESKCSVCGYVSKTETINATGYKITFDAKGGTLTATELHTDKTGKLASLPAATRDGYTFDGWFTAETGGEKVTTEKPFNANITLYAHWTAKSSSSSGGGGGGGGGVTKYAVAVSSADNGKVTPDKTSAAKGSVVTITAMANDGYALDTIKATDKAGKEIKLTDKGDGKYTFTMPASKVEVKAAFKQTASKPGKPAEEMKTVVVMQVGSKTMFVNGKAYEKDAAPVIMNDRTLVPIRFVTESLGGTVAWNAETKEVTLVIDGKEIKMTIGKTIEKYGVAPVIIDSRTFVPVRFVADELGATTAWNAETKTVTITKAVTPVKTEK